MNESLSDVTMTTRMRESHERNGSSLIRQMFNYRLSNTKI